MIDAADTLPFGFFTGMEVFSPYSFWSGRGAGAGSEEFRQSLLAAISDASPDGILVMDGAGAVVSWNHRFEEIWNIPVEDRRAFVADVQEHYAMPGMASDCEITLPDRRTLERRFTVLRGPDGHHLGCVWFFHDATAWKNAQSQLEALVRHDALTGLINRRYFDERARQEFARAARDHSSVAIMAFDLDQFRRVNDRFGHAEGDELIKAVCRTCSGMMRTTSLFARIGGEEFAVLLPATNIDGTLIFSERLRAAVAGVRIVADGKTIGTTISIGIALRQGSDDTAEECLVRADQAMRLAKSKGRNRVEVAS